MQNGDISNIADFQEREGKLFLKVTEDSDKKLIYESIEKFVASTGVVNANFAKIRSVIDGASGDYELVGPIFEYYDSSFTNLIQVKKKPLEALLLVKKEIAEEGLSISLDILISRLKRGGVTYGLKRDELLRVVEKGIVEEWVVVAVGTAPQKGEDGKIGYCVTLDKSFTPKMRDDGSVDYRQIHSFTQVKQGDVVAQRIPPSEGIPGRSVGGEELPAEPGNPVTLTGGDNLTVSADGEKIIAGSHGVIYPKDGGIILQDFLEISGDVDFEVGNINFPGKIIVNGSVKAGFEIVSESDILIHGDVEAAKVRSTGGTVQIEQGVIGRDVAEIFAKQRINVSFAQSALLVTEGVVNVTSSLLHCRVKCVDCMSDSGGVVIGGEVLANRSIDIGVSGNEDGTRTSLTVVDRERSELIEKRSSLVSAELELDKLLLPCERDYRAKTQMVKKLGGNLSPKIKQEYAKSAQRLKVIQEKLKLVKSNIAMIDSALDKMVDGDGFIKIRENVYAGTKVKLYKYKRLFEEDCVGVECSVEEGKMKILRK